MLNKLCCRLQYQYSINYGGCCYVAYCISRMLEKDHIPFTVCIMGTRIYTKLRNIKQSQPHYYLKVGETSINGSPQWLYTVSHLTDVTSRMLLFHYKKHEWNDSYDYGNNLLIRKIIEDSYDKFVQNLR